VSIVFVPRVAFLVATVLLQASTQPSDITGWHGVPWDTTKAAFGKALGCDPSASGLIACVGKIHLRDCAPVPISTDPQKRRREQELIDIDRKLNVEYHKCEPPDIDQFQIEGYPVNHIDYDVDIVFAKGYGLANVIMTYSHFDPSAYETALAELRDRYGDPTQVPKEDQLEWTWVKPHGNITLSVHQGGSFTISYSRKMGRNTL
jgi:hypothetical protein